MNFDDTTCAALKMDAAGSELLQRVWLMQFLEMREEQLLCSLLPSIRPHRRDHERRLPSADRVTLFHDVQQIIFEARDRDDVVGLLFSGLPRAWLSHLESV
jgi:hypothetical protein